VASVGLEHVYECQHSGDDAEDDRECGRDSRGGGQDHPDCDVVVGAFVASSHHYFTDADTLKPLASALLAVLLWPPLLLGINLHIK